MEWSKEQFEKSTINFHLDSQAPSLIFNAFPEEEVQYLLLSSKMHYHPKNYFIIHKKNFYRWNEKIILDFNVRLRTDCWYLPNVLKDPVVLY